MAPFIRYLPFFFLLFVIACGPGRSIHKISSGTRSSNADEDVRGQLTSIARQYEGARYKYGSEGPRSFDCSGFTRFVYAKVGVQLPRRSVDQAQYGKKVSLDRVASGDLLVLKKGRKVQHVGIVVEADGEGLWVTHASTSRGVITENMATSSYWKPRIRYARRVLP
jgi:cell wall-associated NlpC family hydrolase